MFSIVNRLSGGGKVGLAQFVNSGSGVMEWDPYESKMNSNNQKGMTGRCQRRQVSVS